MKGWAAGKWQPKAAAGYYALKILLGRKVLKKIDFLRSLPILAPKKLPKVDLHRQILWKRFNRGEGHRTSVYTPAFSLFFPNSFLVAFCSETSDND